MPYHHPALQIVILLGIMSVALLEQGQFDSLPSSSEIEYLASQSNFKELKEALVGVANLCEIQVWRPRAGMISGAHGLVSMIAEMDERSVRESAHFVFSSAVTAATKGRMSEEDLAELNGWIESLSLALLSPEEVGAILSRRMNATPLSGEQAATSLP